MRLRIIDRYVVVHFAAESHVDRSVLDATDFVRTNVVGTQVLLDQSRQRGIRRFVHVSTDEVYGSLGATGLFTEETPVQPNSPYSASKALRRPFGASGCTYSRYGLSTTRCSNNYGPYQFPEKLIPLMIANAATRGKVIADLRRWPKRSRLDSRFSDSLQGNLAQRWKPGRRAKCTTSVGTRENIFVVKEILRLVGKDEDLIRYVTRPSRP